MCVHIHLVTGKSYSYFDAHLPPLTLPLVTQTSDFLPGLQTPRRPRPAPRGPARRAVTTRGRYYLPPRTSAQRGQGASEDSAVYFQQRGHFSLVVGVTITLYEDSSRISPPVTEKRSQLVPLSSWRCRGSFPKLPPPPWSGLSRHVSSPRSGVAT